MLSLPASAASLSVERIRISALTPPAAVPTGITLQLSSPPTYTRGTATGAEGSWIGPHYEASGDSSLGGNVSMRWSVGFDTTSPTAKAAAIAGPTRGWRYLRKDPIGIPHVVAKHVIGTVNGFAYITHGVDAFDASYEAVLAVPMARTAFAMLRFELDDPPTDTASDGSTFVVDGLVAPSDWNRGQIFWALSGVQLLGNLPPERIRLHGSRHTQLRGDAIDFFRNPVAKARVVLERHVARGWKRVAAAKTSFTGTYAFERLSPGVYRTEVTVEKVSARSGSVRLR
jgi:hypothetical protein